MMLEQLLGLAPGSLGRLLAEGATSPQGAPPAHGGLGALPATASTQATPPPPQQAQPQGLGGALMPQARPQGLGGQVAPSRFDDPGSHSDPGVQAMLAQTRVSGSYGAGTNAARTAQGAHGMGGGVSHRGDRSARQGNGGGGIMAGISNFLDGGQGRENQTVEWLVNTKGYDPGAAAFIAEDRETLQGVLRDHVKGVKPDLQVQSIYDDQGRETKVLMDMRTGETRPLGGSKSDVISPDAERQKARIAQAGKTDITIDNGKLTESQSKDIGFYSRGKYALADLETLDEQLTSASGYLANKGGTLGNFWKDPEYQLAEGAGRDFLAIILRKDTGAAVTPQEFELYGKTYLPWPGDDQKNVEAKRIRRSRALTALRRGLGTASPLADDIDAQFKAEMDAGRDSSRSRNGAGGDESRTRARNPQTNEIIEWDGTKWGPAR